MGRSQRESDHNGRRVFLLQKQRVHHIMADRMSTEPPTAASVRVPTCQDVPHCGLSLGVSVPLSGVDGKLVFRTSEL